MTPFGMPTTMVNPSFGASGWVVVKTAVLPVLRLLALVSAAPSGPV